MVSARGRGRDNSDTSHMWRVHHTIRLCRLSFADTDTIGMGAWGKNIAPVQPQAQGQGYLSYGIIKCISYYTRPIQVYRV